MCVQKSVFDIILTYIKELEDDADDVDADAQDYAAMLKELGNDDGDWEGETGLGKGIFYVH